MAIFKDFFSSTRSPKSDSQTHEAAHSLGGPETAPVKMNLEERMAFRRELLFDAVRATLHSRYIASNSYRFKVMRTDKRGHCFVVMLDMAPAFMASPQGQHAQLAEIAATLTQNALAKYGLILGGVYWRVDETLNTVVAQWARPPGLDAPVTPAPPPATPTTGKPPSNVENYERVTADELAAFEAAWQKNSEIQIGNRTYSSDLAPLGEDPPRD
ncbi:MAG: hypothetical protein ABIP46_11585 [Polaromonas sp.]